MFDQLHLLFFPRWAY